MLVDTILSLGSCASNVSGFDNLYESYKDIKNKQYKSAAKNLAEAGIRLAITHLVIKNLVGFSQFLDDGFWKETPFNAANGFCKGLNSKHKYGTNNCLDKVFILPQDIFKQLANRDYWVAQRLGSEFGYASFHTFSNNLTSDESIDLMFNTTKGNEVLSRLMV